MKTFICTSPIGFEEKNCSEKNLNYILWHPGADTVLRPLMVEALGVSVLDVSLRGKLTSPSSNFTFLQELDMQTKFVFYPINVWLYSH